MTAGPMLTADDIQWELSAVNDKCSGRLLRLVAEALPAIEDDFEAKLVVQLSLAVIDRDDDLTAVRKVLSTSLALAHSRHWETVRLLESLARLRAENRTLRGQPLRQPEAA